MITKMGIWRWALAGAAVVILAGTAYAGRDLERPLTTTNDPAAIVVLPKIVVDTNLCQRTSECSVSGETCSFTPGDVDANDSACPDAGIDTVIGLTNTSEFLTRVKCFYVNANGHCSNDPTTVCTQANFRDACPPGGLCVDGWQETDFVLTLTKRQPVSWSANEGLSELPLANQPGQGDPPQFNDGSIPPIAENPFHGELRCIQLDSTTELPIDRNDLKAEASIVTTDGPTVDARKYNGIGIQAIEGAQDGDPNTLNIGGPEPEYNPCPNIITLNHFFEEATVVTHANGIEGRVVSDLTVVPCAADFLNQDQNLASATLQFLIFNEFEQRFSTSTRVTCFKETRLADIDTRPGPDGDSFSIFSSGVQGTLTGQSRIRPVAGPNIDGYAGRTVLALLEEFWDSGTCVPEASEACGGSCPKKLETAILCDRDEECPGGFECVNPKVSTASANIQHAESFREQGDRMRIPIP